MKQSQFYYLLRRGLFSAGSAIIKNGLVMFNKFTTAGISHPAQGSAEFNGSSDYIDLGEKHIANDLGITNAFTMGAWIYFENDAYYKNILSMWDNTGNRLFWWGLDNAEQFHYNISLSGGDHAVNTYSMTPNEWHYVNFRYNGSSLSLWHNGSSVFGYGATGNVDSRDSSNLTESLLISAQDDTAATAFMNGNLANVAIWNRALSSDEINSVMWKSYEGLTSKESTGLQAWYSLDDITSPAASLANMQQLATDKNATIENTAAITAAINSLS